MVGIVRGVKRIQRVIDGVGASHDGCAWQEGLRAVCAACERVFRETARFPADLPAALLQPLATSQLFARVFAEGVVAW